MDPRRWAAALCGGVLAAGAVLAAGPGAPAAAAPAAAASTGPAPAAVAPTGPAPTGPAPSATLTVGTRTLHPCTLSGVPAWCGTLPVPLDYTDAAAGTITVGFGWRPAAGATRTVVAQEGGPGYPSTGTTGDYVTLFGPLLAARNLLVVDQRGTGRSTPLDCPALQRGVALTTSPAFLSAAAACGDQLNHTFRRAGGGWVHASDLFTTANATRDLAAVLRALQQDPVDLYGDSYGTYFAQAFLARFPASVRDVVLDSAYEARDLDPWYTTAVTTARSAFQAVCDRQPACQLLGPEPVWTRLGRLLAALRRAPVSGPAPTLDGTVRQVTVDVTALVDMVNDAGYDVGPYRDLYAAAGAWLDRHDPAPLLRLWAQDIGFDYATTPVPVYSEGLYEAVSCTDYPQLFDLRASLAERRRQLAASVAALPAATFAPFTTSEWLQLSPNVEPYTACLSWPAPAHAPDPPVPPGVAMNPLGVPVLILNGDLDSLTPAPGGAHIARQMVSGARAVVVRNMVHLVGLADRYGCGRSLVQRFLADPSHLATLSTSCSASVPPVGTVATFPASLAAAPPAPGDAPDAARRLAWVAAATAADVADRGPYLDGATDRGLRGGSSRAAGATTTITGWRWVPDVAVDGTVTVTGLSGRATLQLRPDGGAARRCEVAWTLTGPFDAASVRCGADAFVAPAP